MNWPRSPYLRLLPLLTALPAHAHPGHPLADHGASHIVASPYHIATLAASGAALWLVARWWSRPLPRRLLRGLGLTAVLIAFVLAFAHQT